MAVTVRGDRGAFGGALTPPQASPLRLGALAARAASSALVSLGPNGDVVAGALTVGDMPLGSDWTWGTGTTITFAPGPLAVPAPTSRSLGTRLVLEPVPGSTEYAIGRASGALWTSVPTLTAHAWYQGATERLRLETDGSLKLTNGSGLLQLTAAGTGNGTLFTTGTLDLSALGAITVSSNGQILPALGYRENLGALPRKFLSLHCAELWAETLVAQHTLATIGGRILVGPTTTLTRDCAAADTQVYVKHNAFRLFTGGVHGSKLVLQSNGKFEVMSVESTSAPSAEPAGDYRYTVLRNSDGSGANDWYAGDAIFDTGVTAAPPGAFIDLYSVSALQGGSTAGPTIVGNVRVSNLPTGWREHWAVGNLQGLYGNSTQTMGAAFGDVNGTHLQIDATDGIRMRGSIAAGGVVTGHWDLAGNLSLGTATAGRLTYLATDGSLRITWNGASRLTLLNDGNLYLSSGLIAGAFAGEVATIRSANATDWNAGSGFFFRYTKNTDVTTALIGNSGGRRLTWDGASLKVISDGLTIDENGITLQQQASGAYAPTRAIQWSPSGAYMWDSSVNNGFELQRSLGYINIVAYSTTGLVMLQGGGAGIDRTTLTLRQASMELGGVLTGGTRPSFLPNTDGEFALGSAAKRWQSIHAVYHMGGYGLFAGASSFTRYLELGANSAMKPVSSTWEITPSDRAAKDEITPVDPEDALALIRRIPLVRFRYTGALGSPVGARGIGVVAQDLEPILPASVSRGIDGRGALGWDAHEMFTLTTAAVQALAARLDTLEGKADR